MHLADTIRWFFALPDPAVDRSAMTRAELRIEAFQRQRRTPFGRGIIRYHIFLESLPYRVHGIVRIIWRATAGRWLWIKCADFAEIEIANMRYVAKHTDIPVPRVWFTYKWNNREYIVMDRIAGITFDALRGGHLQDGDKQDAIAGQMARHMAQLRALPSPPESSISSVLCGPVRCPRLFQDPLYGPTAPSPPTGPCKREATMNLQLRHLRSLETFDPIVVAAHSTAHPLVFTHNDLVPRNIMVDHATGKVVAIIDWEYAGWFPAHWEICMMTNWERQSIGLGWRGWIPKILPRDKLAYAQDLEADALLLRALGVPEHHASDNKCDS
ncbi:kinase-like domain-containing protein [Mycena belliarum]|uniref:Kinase-like domain-containing protein n=1 Tax=Mycena belliarum TaxID=1033014 RepID=A0AAD6U9N3_9AGAR|nr:kinase-like domain-containing protein [Mycena belliae]